LEDLDSLSGTVAFAHCAATKPLLVTASVDAINLVRSLTLEHDLIMSGQVVWTGSSSLDVRMEVRQGVSVPSLAALFSYVALDPDTKRPFKVPQWNPETEQEKTWFAERQVVAERRRTQRQIAKQGGVHESHPDVQPLLSSLNRFAQFLSDLPALAPPSLLPIASTCLEDAFLVQSQHRNTAGRAFGGFLMRRAFELSFASAFLFAGARPAFVRCDEVSFEKPVDIGSLLKFSARVFAAWPEPDGVQVDGKVPWLIAAETVAHLVQPEKRTVERTNAFKYILRCRLPANERARIVVPTTEEDAIRLESLLGGLGSVDLKAYKREVEQVVG
jgi:acyl-coenzyme A thioesterase 9